VFVPLEVVLAHIQATVHEGIAVCERQVGGLHQWASGQGRLLLLQGQLSTGGIKPRERMGVKWNLLRLLKDQGAAKGVLVHYRYWALRNTLIGRQCRPPTAVEPLHHLGEVTVASSGIAGLSLMEYPAALAHICDVIALALAIAFDCRLPIQDEIDVIVIVVQIFETISKRVALGLRARELSPTLG
jgi:hypothetical protein